MREIVDMLVARPALAAGLAAVAALLWWWMNPGHSKASTRKPSGRGRAPGRGGGTGEGTAGWRRIMETAARGIVYWLVEDDRPLVARMPGVSMRRVTLAAAIFAAGAIWLNEPLFAVVVATPVACVGVSRGVAACRARDRQMRRMFDIAARCLRYPRGAVDNWRDWVRVPGWEGPTCPKQVIVSVPAGSSAVTDKARDEFENAWSTTVTSANDWEFEWEHTRDRLVATPTPALPVNVPLPPAPVPSAWNRIPLGVTYAGVEVAWDPGIAPHMLVTGRTGSGKSVAQRSILSHVCTHPLWRLIAIDPKTVELCQIEKEPHVLRYATELEDMLDALETAHGLMLDRRAVLRDAGVKQWADLPDPEPFLLVMVDETFNLLSPEKGAGEHIQARNKMKERCGFCIGEITRLGRALGVHAVLATQRPDADVLSGEVKNNCDFRLAVGRMDEIASKMSLGSLAACNLKPGVRGRAMTSQAQVLVEMQTYFCPEEGFSETLAGTRARWERLAHDDVAPAPGDLTPGDNRGNPKPSAAELGVRFGERIRAGLARTPGR